MDLRVCPCGPPVMRGILTGDQLAAQRKEGRGRETGRDGGTEGGREGGTDGGREGGREGGRDGGREGRREGGREGELRRDLGPLPNGHRIQKYHFKKSRKASRLGNAAKTPPRKREYCLYYCRFGVCKRGDACKYIHDPKKIAVCRRFLTGVCDDPNCPLWHKVQPEKMPHCRNFLRGSCFRTDCPYLHVKVRVVGWCSRAVGGVGRGGEAVGCGRPRGLRGCAG